jgi:hypothetical protein
MLPGTGIGGDCKREEVLAAQDCSNLVNPEFRHAG